MLSLEFETTSRSDMRDITSQLRSVVRRNAIEKGWRNGVLALFCPHTTCGLTVNEGADPDVRRDMLTFFNGLVPRLGDYHHAEGNSDAHIKATLTGASVTLMVEGGRLLLGQWQRIFLCEFDGPRSRRLRLKMVAG